MLKVGIVGLPNTGKSTLFNALLQRQIANVAEYPFTTIEPNVGVVQVPDERLQAISEVTGIDTIVPSAIEFIDIAGLVKGAYQGEGLGNQFLGHIREVDALLHLIRVFHNPNVSGEPNPQEDIKIIEEELRQARIEKPTIYVINIDESKLNKEESKYLISKVTHSVRDSVLALSAKLEAELSELSPEERKDFLLELGVESSALDQVIKKCYELLGLITFFTIAKGKSPSAKASEGLRQVQAWPLRAGTTALRASGLVHTDMEKGFIKAEVTSWNKLLEAGNWKLAADKGWVRLEGRDYKIADGDVVEFKFNQ
ncbi:MAG: hypothetical protein A2Z11_02865 [Candidatus Woykebacteria bacterium RBG_16_43_9]|uniref:OBG-type G domain-containing protein n=1 Tax=Candidatus Woykebacteria bacterium RBG_16_43_9 TaxID=1802596 RepID=A0A1G1WCC6_9BACT|nr:MAG: hypothetical protein A2Z11_02865 [Candidatus Woykebacteria bacterium RBG_16_43_9]